MEETVKLLIALQEYDIRIKDKQAQKAKGPLAVQKRKEELEDVEAQLQTEIDNVNEHNSLRGETDQELKVLDDQLKKAENKLSQIASNKEYRAALKEIDELKRQKDALESRAIELMEQKENLEAACEDNKKKAAEMKKKYEQDCQQILENIKILDRDLEDLELERKKYSKRADQSLLKKYDMLKGHKGGIAITPVIKGVCQTCHMAIPPQKFNELIRGDKLMKCPNCARIMYWGEDDRYQDNPESG